jgi:DNA-directed RNA polymerase II subunit RPB2
VADRDIIEHVVYDLTDGEMMDMFRPSLEEAFVIQRRRGLDLIGRRGSARDVTKEDRMRYAQSILQKEVLPHVGTEEHCEGKKGFFIDTPCTSYSCASWGVPPRTIVITLVKATGSGGPLL